MTKGRIVDTILFDMDGTLLDTLDDLHASVNYALGRAGLPLVTFDETREAAGYGSIVLIELLTKHAFATGSPEFQRVFDDFNAHYKEHCNDRTQPYPGVLELLAGLGERGLKMAIVSNKVQPETEALRELWFSDFIPVAVGRGYRSQARSGHGSCSARKARFASWGRLVRRRFPARCPHGQERGLHECRLHLGV